MIKCNKCGQTLRFVGGRWACSCDVEVPETTGSLATVYIVGKMRHLGDFDPTPRPLTPEQLARVEEIKKEVARIGVYISDREAD